MPLTQPYPELAALDLLVSVAELGSISAAARAHHITQPAASMRLRALEETLQVTLLDRGKTGARLTPGGLATVEWANAVLREVRALQAGTAALRADQITHLQLAASLTVAEYLLPRWLERFTAAMPEVALSLQMGNTAHVTELVLDAAVELGFVEGPEPPVNVESYTCGSDRLIVVVAAGHPWAGRPQPLTANELAQTPLVLREPGSGTREVLADALHEHGLRPVPAIELGSTTAIKAAVISGAGPAVLSERASEAELYSGQLVAVPHDGLRLERAIRAIWRQGHTLSPAAAELLALAASRRELGG